MQYIEQEIKGVWLIVPRRYGDERGYFSEVFKRDEFERHIGKVDFIQHNESRSRFGVLRGLHFQRAPWSQAKLVRVSQGRVLDVAVDLRGDSPTFGKYCAQELTAARGEQLFIPRGFAHGFVVLSQDAQFQYLVDNEYAPHAEQTIQWDDPALGIDWQVSLDEVILSEKDKHGIPLNKVNPF